jgi:hypothetical protein
VYSKVIKQMDLAGILGRLPTSTADQLLNFNSWLSPLGNGSHTRRLKQTYYPVGTMDVWNHGCCVARKSTCDLTSIAGPDD